MATIDDVYNLLTNGLNGLTAIRVLASAASADANRAAVHMDNQFGNWPGGTNAWTELDTLYNAIVTADPNLAEAIRQLTDSGGGTIRNAVGTALNILYDITGSYLSTAPEFDHPESILKALYAAVYRTFPVPEE